MNKIKRFSRYCEERDEDGEERDAIGVNADVAQHRQSVGQGLLFCKTIARIRDGRAAEIQRVAALVQHRLDDIGAAHRLFIVNGVAGCGDRAFGMGMQVFGDGAYQLGWDHQRSGYCRRDRFICSPESQAST